jgi:predicted glycosyltransferase
MRCLVLANTPAHVHTYKHAVARLEEEGHDVLVLARDYACTVALCEYYDLPFEVYGSHDTEEYSMTRFARELPGHLLSLFRAVRAFDPEVAFGRGPYAAWVGSVSDAKTILLLDSEPGELAHRVSSQFADLVLTPASFDGRLGDAHHTFDGLKECAYLHPETFEADPTVRDDLGIDPDEPYAVLRFNAFDALHDVDQVGLTREEEHALIDAVSDRATVFVSHEGEGLDLSDHDARAYDLHPARIHDALAEASLLVAETGTMVTEAALLGTPAVGCGAFADWDFGEFAALEDAGLIEVTATYDDTVAAATRLVDDETATDRWARRRDEFLDGRVELTELLVSVARNPGHAPGLDGLDARTTERRGERAVTRG